MSGIVYFLRTAARNLRRGGQRVLVALLCIAFGVMSLVAMTLLSASVDSILVFEPPMLIGADISMDRMTEEVILPEHIEELDTMKQAGTIERYSLVGYTSTLAFRKPGSGSLHFPGAGIGIDPGNYPLIGSITIGEPANTGQAALLQAVGDVLVTRDMADIYKLSVGDALVLADRSVGATVEGRVRGIVTNTPNHEGSKFYYSLETAAALADSPRYLNTVLVTAAAPGEAQEQLSEQGWRVFLAEEMAWNDQQVQGMIELGLKGAGILGLLVGGIGIANTMQVLLRRRRKEVAVWKTIGYREGELQLLFALEAALLGTAGSLIGGAVGVGVSYVLVGLFQSTSTMLITWVVPPLVVAGSVLIGIVTSVIFAMLAIVTSSRVSPLALLRNESLKTDRMPRMQSLGLGLLCAVPFTLVVSLVMESFWAGLGVLLFALGGLTALGGFFAGLIWLVTRLLPLRGLPLAHLSRNNLRRRGISLVFAMIALFVGVVSLALGAVVTQNAERELEEHTIEMMGDNITILAPAEQEADIRQAAEAHSLLHFTVGYQSPVREVRFPGDPDTLSSALLIGRDEPSEFTINGPELSSRPEGVYIFSMSQVQPGKQVEVVLWDGQVRTLPVIGTYTVDLGSLRPEFGLLMTNDQLKEIIAPQTVQAFLKAPASQVRQVTDQLGVTLPGAMVIDQIAYVARFTQQYQNLFIFAVAMAGLALLAGVMLVANSVSLAMLDRRYEIGVLKAMGYSRGQVLTTLVVEYSLVGLIASAAGLAVVAIFLKVVGMLNSMAGDLFSMPPLSALAIGLCGVGLTLLTVLLVTWSPTQVSPVVVLNDRE